MSCSVVKEDPEYSKLLDKANMMELVNGFHAPMCNTRTVEWIQMHDDFMNKYHFSSSSDFHSDVGSLKNNHTILHMADDVNYNTVFDTLKARPGEKGFSASRLIQEYPFLLILSKYFLQVFKE